MLAVVYGLEKYHHYVYGRDVIVYTDHKPLVNIKQKSLAKAPKRLQSMLLRIQDYKNSSPEKQHFRHSKAYSSPSLDLQGWDQVQFEYECTEYPKASPNNTFSDIFLK